MIYQRRLARRLMTSDNLGAAGDFLKTYLVPMDQPVVLISQADRSGGTLLSQLFDGHPNIAAYPHELRFGLKSIDQWPELEGDVDKDLESLFDLTISRMTGRGFVKGSRAPVPHRFFFMPSIYADLFRILGSDDDQRVTMNHHFTAFFNAWLDFQGDLSQTKWITAFAPRLANSKKQAHAFFSDYPDGHMIQIVREPSSWLASALKQNRQDKSAAQLVDGWLKSARSIRRNKDDYGDRVTVIQFEDLTKHTKSTMKYISGILGINFGPQLENPTFNKMATWPNSSFPVSGPGLIRDRKTVALSQEDSHLVRTTCGKIYGSVRKLGEIQ